MKLKEEKDKMENKKEIEGGIEKIIETLSPLEIKIMPYLNLKIAQIEKKSGLDSVSMLRALRFLEDKGIVRITKHAKTIVELGVNGVYYRKHHLPERRLIILFEEKNSLLLEDAKKLSRLTDNEFKAALGVLKDKALVSLENGKMQLKASKDELTKKTFEEKLLEVLPKEKESLSQEELFALEKLKNRKEIIKINEKTLISFELTDLGKQIAGKEIKSGLIEELTPGMLNEVKDWKGKKFRKYDIKSHVPAIHGGKKHFINQSIEYARKIWLEMGFTEMTGNLTDSSFWIFDALFTPQNHPAREMQDTFFIKNIHAKLPDKKIIESVKKAHELGVGGSKGWRYQWSNAEAKKLVLRTQTTGLSARTLAKLKEADMPAKYFAIGKVFRNETLDWNHAFEFYQSEGIVIDKNANFRHLLGYLKEFYKKMGFEKIRFRPSYFAYTEPSVEIEVFNEEKQLWIELGGAGIFRPEVVIPLLGKNIPVLAWGQGFDRIIMDYYKIKDLREMYANDIKQLREKKLWLK